MHLLKCHEEVKSKKNVTSNWLLKLNSVKENEEVLHLSMFVYIYNHFWRSTLKTWKERSFKVSVKKMILKLKAMLSRMKL